MGIVVCPKCGRVQDSGAECRSCGLVFGRYHRARRPASQDYCFSSVGLLQRACRVGCWVSVAAALLAMLLALHQSPAPQIQTSPVAGNRVQAKIARFENAADGSGQLRILRMNEAELNSWLITRAAAEAEATVRERMEQDQDPDKPSNIRDVRVKLLENRILAYIAFDFHGKEMSLELEGRLLAQDGYLRLEPIAGRLGALPLPAAALERTSGRIFYSKENREKFRLPEDIRDIRVEGRELVIVAR